MPIAKNFYRPTESLGIPTYLVFVRNGTFSNSTTYAVILGQDGSPISVIDSRVLGLEYLQGIMWGNTLIVMFEDPTFGNPNQGFHAWNPFDQTFHTYDYSGPAEFNGIVSMMSSVGIGSDNKLYWIEMEFDDGAHTHNWILVSTEDRSLNGLDRFNSLSDVDNPPSIALGINPAILANDANPMAPWETETSLIRVAIAIQTWGGNPLQKLVSTKYVNLHKSDDSQSSETVASLLNRTDHTHGGYWKEDDGVSGLRSQCMKFGNETPHGVVVWPVTDPTSHGSGSDKTAVSGSLDIDGNWVSIVRDRPATSDGQGAIIFGLPIVSPSVTVIDIPDLKTFILDNGGELGGGTFRLTAGSKISTLPELSILSPNEGQSFGEGLNVTFNASVFSSKFESLEDDIVWNSNVNGNFGVGAPVNFSGLSVGGHTITATVEDPDTNTAQATVRIEIIP